jgi:hypothetical protein
MGSLLRGSRRQVDKICSAIQPLGMNHVILGLFEAHLVEFLSQQNAEGVQDIQTNYGSERMMPALV